MPRSISWSALKAYRDPAPALGPGQGAAATCPGGPGAGARSSPPQESSRTFLESLRLAQRGFQVVARLGLGESHAAILHGLAEHGGVIGPRVIEEVPQAAPDKRTEPRNVARRMPP